MRMKTNQLLDQLMNIKCFSIKEQVISAWRENNGPLKNSSLLAEEIFICASQGLNDCQICGTTLGPRCKEHTL